MTAPATERSIDQAGERRIARVESLRALAALSVLEGHAFLLSRSGNFTAVTDTFPHRVLLGGGTAVYLFFALTGYLLFLPFARQSFGDGREIDLLKYARNRALRILPLYYAALLLFMIVQADGGTFGQWWRFLTFSENFFTSTVGTVDGVMWSLVVEIHFYVLLPLLALALGRLSRANPWRAAALLLALGAASLYLQWHLVDDNSRPNLRWEYSLPVTFCFFVPGMVLALLRTRVDSNALRARLRGLASSDLWLVAALVVWAITVNSFRNTWLATVASFLTVGACVLPLREGPLTRALDWRPLAVVGVASYSVYLLHFPILTWFAPDVTTSYPVLLAGVGVLALAVSLGSYRLIEAPFLRLRRLWA